MTAEGPVAGQPATGSRLFAEITMSIHAPATISPCASCEPDRWADVVAGAGALLPWLVGLVPFGLGVGVTSANASAHTGVSGLTGWLTAPLIFSGSAQVAALDLLTTGAAPLVVVAAVLAINLRLVVYSAAMAPYWRDTPRWWRALAAYLLIDPTLAVGTAGYDHALSPERGHRYYLGAGVALWMAWLAAVGVGATAGARLPAALHLEFVVPLFLAGEVVSRLTTRQAQVATAVATTAAVLAFSAPVQTGPLIAIGLGLAAGLAVDARVAAR